MRDSCLRCHFFFEYPHSLETLGVEPAQTTTSEEVDNEEHGNSTIQLDEAKKSAAACRIRSSNIG